MGISKTELFTEQQNQLANIAKVIGHPARVAILQRLSEIKGCICGDLVEELGLAQPTISQHLKELKNAGLIKGTIEGTSICYCIEPVKWAECAGLFELFFSGYKLQGITDCETDCC